MPRPPTRDQLGALYLNHLDAETARHHLEQAGDEIRLAATQVRDVARREAQEGWKRLDRRMEGSEWMGSGPDGGVMEFTRWDALKKGAEDALMHPYAGPFPTPNLEKSVRQHAGFAKKYGSEAIQEGQATFNQAVMVGREAAELERRKLVLALRDEGSQDGPQPFQALRNDLASSPLFMHPLTGPSDSRIAYTTPMLRKSIGYHSAFARKFGEYTKNDAQAAVEQVGLAGREAAELERRRLVLALRGERHLSQPYRPVVLKSQQQPDPTPSASFPPPSSTRPRRMSVGEGLMDAAGVALDVGLGLAAGREVERLRRKREKGY
ncbi:hypothetical protein JCM8547_001779 [Rhodosporidiobolus lusitaniae]